MQINFTWIKNKKSVYLISKNKKPNDMSYLEQQLKKLEEVASNPNLNGGIYKSLALFISTSDELLKKQEVLGNTAVGLGISKEDVFRELESIRVNFEKSFGFVLEASDNFGSKFESRKNSPSTGPKFRRQLAKFMESYRGKFLVQKWWAWIIYSRFILLFLLNPQNASQIHV